MCCTCFLAVATAAPALPSTSHSSWTGHVRPLTSSNPRHGEVTMHVTCLPWVCCSGGQRSVSCLPLSLTQVICNRWAHVSFVKPSCHPYLRSFASSLFVFASPPSLSLSHSLSSSLSLSVLFSLSVSLCVSLCLSLIYIYIPTSGRKRTMY